MSRNLSVEMAEFINDRIPEGEYVAADLALTIFTELEKADPDLLEGWLRITALSNLTGQISRRRLGLVNRARRQPSAGLTAALAAHESGDSEPLSIFVQHMVISDDNVVRPIGKLKKADHLYIAERYGKRARAYQMESAFHRAVANLLKEDETTEEVMSEEEYLRLRESLSTP